MESSKGQQCENDYNNCCGDCKRVLEAAAIATGAILFVCICGCALLPFLAASFVACHIFTSNNLLKCTQMYVQDSPGMDSKVCYHALWNVVVCTRKGHH